MARNYAVKLNPKTGELENHDKVVRRIRSELVSMQSDDKYAPVYRVLLAAVEIARAGIDMELFRRDHFSNISQETWARFKRNMFALQISSAEDVGHELLLTRDSAISNIRTQIKRMKELQKERPGLYHKQIIQAEESIMKIQSDVAKSLVSVGAVGSKKAGSSVINIYNYIPRPEAPTRTQKVIQARTIVAVDTTRLDAIEDAKITTAQLSPSETDSGS